MIDSASSMASGVCFQRIGLLDHKTPPSTRISDDLAIVNSRTESAPANETSCHAHTSYRGRIKRPHSTPNPSRRRSDGLDSTGPPRRFQAWLSSTVIDDLQQKANTDVKKTKAMYEAVLNREDTLVKDMEGIVQHKDMLDFRKKEILHKNWTEQVHKPIRKQIVEQMSGPGYPELMSRKRELHKEYLEHVNKKGHVFLDTIAPDEYYALSLHPTRPSLLVAETKTLRDPLIAQERQRNSEERVMFRCETGSVLSDRALTQMRLPPVPLVPLGRHGTECRTWLAMPMGDIESPVRFASRRRMYPDANRSQCTFTHWGKSTDQSRLDEELGTQKRQLGLAESSEVSPTSPENDEA